jgi:hypothetical protein
MRVALLLAAASLPALAQESPIFDGDLFLGLSKPTTEFYGDEIAPAFALRLGLRPTSWLSLGIRGDLVPGAEGAEVAFIGSGRGGQNWSAGSADVRFILNSPKEVYLGGAIGIGHMVNLQCACQETYAIHGSGKHGSSTGQVWRRVAASIHRLRRCLRCRTPPRRCCS